ncbi:MAG TPA: PAS domain S-box protein [Candidatus Binatia bacterium]|nr:PAS domain S-box protein [Candidatus Binatia bacterium]
MKIERELSQQPGPPGRAVAQFWGTESVRLRSRAGCAWGALAPGAILLARLWLPYERGMSLTALFLAATIPISAFLGGLCAGLACAAAALTGFTLLQLSPAALVPFSPDLQTAAWLQFAVAGCLLSLLGEALRRARLAAQTPTHSAMRVMILRATLLFGISAAVWTVLSDVLMVRWVADQTLHSALDVSKDWAFVGLCSLLLYLWMDKQVCSQEHESELRREAEAARRLWADAFEHCAHGIAVGLRDSPQTVACNSAFARMHGMTAEEISSISVADLYEPSARPYFEFSLREADRNGQFQFQTLRRRRDGSVFPAQVDVVSVRNQEGCVLYRVATVQDMTERHAHEREIERLNRLYGALSAINGTIVRVSSREELFQGICQATVEHAGFKLVWIGWCEDGDPEVKRVAWAGEGHAYLDQVHVFTDDRPEGRGPVGTCIREGRPCVSNDFLVEGHTTPWHQAAASIGLRSVAALPIQLEGKVRGAFTVYAEEPDAFHGRELDLLAEAARDASFALNHLEQERKRLQAESNLRTSEERFLQIAESIKEVFWLADAQCDVVLYVNPSFEWVWGRPCAELYANPRLWLEVIHPEDQARVVAALERLAQGEPYNLEYRILRADGTERWINDRGYPRFDSSGRVFRTCGVATDVTESRQAGERLRKLSRAVEQSSAAILITDLQGRIEYTNPKFTQVTGYSFEDVRGLNPRILKSGETSPEEYRRLWTSITRGDEWQGEFHNRKKSGELYWEFASISPIVDEAGRVTHFLAVKEDITRRKEAEEALRRQSSLFDQTYDAVLVWEWDGPLTFWNRGAERLYGYEREEALGKYPHTLLATKARGGNDVFLGALARDSRWEGELEQTTRDGKIIRLESRMVLLRESGRAYILEVNRDITDRHLLEDQLRQAQKMEAVGRLAGGVAHDFNNILGVILGYCSLVLDKLEDPALRRQVEEVEKAGQRATGLTRQLLAFSRKQVLEPRVLNLNSLITDLEKMLHRLLGEDVALNADLDPALGQVRVDPGQLEQVLMNLAVNSRDAMPNGGRLILQTRNIESSADAAHPRDSLPPGSYVLLLVSDTGMGMDEKTRTHIFEPFFTTKKTGTGLGLATVHGIVKQSGGQISVETELGKGTTFRISFPRLDHSDQESQVRLPAESIPAGSETILLVEDAEPMRAVAQEFLNLGGYTVLAASNGAEALELLHQRNIPVHLLLTDVIMPGMSGPQLADRIKALRPEIRVLFMSGYTETAIASHGVLEAGRHLIMKPFSRQSLALKVREALSSA